jgi:hypothetical protein
LSDLDLALSENSSLLFDNLPPQAALENMEGQYRTALNGLMAHAIKVATGRMDPPQTFVANPIPPPLGFKKKKFSSGPVATGQNARAVMPARPDDLVLTPGEISFIKGRGKIVRTQ